MKIEIERYKQTKVDVYYNDEYYGTFNNEHECDLFRIKLVQNNCTDQYISLVPSIGAGLIFYINMALSIFISNYVIWYKFQSVYQNNTILLAVTPPSPIA
jgi:hypothetical protein